MAGEEALKPLMFLLMYTLMKRRKDINNADVQRRNEIQRRIRHRQYFFQRQRRMLMMLIARSTRCTCNYRTRAWTNIESTDWWERVVMKEFQPRDWLEKFRMSKDTFFFLCNKLKPRLTRQDTHFRLALPLEKRVAVALWRLATNVEYRTISALFGVGRSTVCKCVRRVPRHRVPPQASLPAAAQRAGDGGRRPALQHALGLPALRGRHRQPAHRHHRALQQHRRLLERRRLAFGGAAGRGQRAGPVLGRVRRVPGQHGGRDHPAELHPVGRGERGRALPRAARSFMGRPLGYLLLGDAAYPLQSWLLKCYPESDGLAPGSAPSTTG
ncbi:hypothetical protein ANANG_G00123530 [Anguilla anguilla]|uniref:DDE Tnp4 domain-containing protein n=1 Tax=Anguilla anguilla TaxID=7936 RepID=A0A9D3MGN3_ANGAN|nr:hypothetical protein ANANG_G00123530 [Anguilla anguilla]